MKKDSTFKATKATALGVAAAGVVAVAFMGSPAAFAAAGDVSHDDRADGCDVHSTFHYDPGTNIATTRVQYHNGWLFAACRVTTGGKINLHLNGVDSVKISFAAPVHKTMACAFTDVKCVHDVDVTFTDFNVLPSQLMPPTWVLDGKEVKTLGGYQATVW